MDKYIKAQDLIDRIHPVDPENDGSDGCTVVYKSLTLSSPEIEAIVEELPAADVAPVVRCRECKHLNVVNNEKLYAHCPKTNTVFLPFQIDTRTHFCSLGERH